MRVHRSVIRIWLGVAATALAVLAFAGVAHAQTAITVNAGAPGAVISGADFGADFLAPDGGLGAFDTTSDTFWPSFTQALQTNAYVGSLRFPGGITAESYDWTRAIGPQAQRTDNPIGPTSAPTDSSVGPDEFGQLLNSGGADGVVTTNFGTGTAAEAAALVQYMTGPNGSSAMADERASNGNAAPYNVPYWEVGNEEYGADYWRTNINSTGLAPTGTDGAACEAAEHTALTCAYIFGGTNQFTQQQVVGYADRTTAATVSNGAANQSFYVKYPPVQTSAASTIYVGNTAWQQVGSLSGVGNADDYTLNATTGQITFGDGVSGAVPPSGATVTASYTSGPHDGFNAFYTAMKQANPAIQVCATDTTADFIAAMGATYPYDCLQDHPYVGAGDVSPSEPIASYENDVMAIPAGEGAAVQALQAQVTAAAGHAVPIELSEYGQLINAAPDPTQVPYYLNSLDEALVNASQLAQWITLGVPVADRQLLTAELPPTSAVTQGLPDAAPFAVTGAITTPGPQVVVQPTAEYGALMSPLAGQALLSSTTVGDPALATTSPGAAPALSVVAGAGGGRVDIVAINRSPSTDIPASITLSGYHGHAAATVTVLDGPDPLSDNTAAAPATVTTTSSFIGFSKGLAHVTLPAHSVALIQLNAVTGLPAATLPLQVSRPAARIARVSTTVHAARVAAAAQARRATRSARARAARSRP